MRHLTDEQICSHDWRGPDPSNDKNRNTNWLRDYMRDLTTKEREKKINKIIKKLK